MPMTFARKAILESLYFSGAQALGRRWFGGTGAVLMLHRVHPAGPARPFDPNAHLSVTPCFLDTLLGKLRQDGVEFVSMDDLVLRLRGEARGAGRPAVAITLDDGYRDNLEHAAPVFARNRAPYTIYVAPGLVDGSATLWWQDLERAIAGRDRIALASPDGVVEFDTSSVGRKRQVFFELLSFLATQVDEHTQRRLMIDLCWRAGVDAEAGRAEAIMTWAEIATIARDPLCTIGAHTLHHFALARLSLDEARHEMKASADVIALELGRPARHFAFPYGSTLAAGARESALAAELGFASAVTTNYGVLHPFHRDRLHDLPRVSVNGNYQKARYVSTLMSGLPEAMQRMAGTLAAARRQARRQGAASSG